MALLEVDELRVGYGFRCSWRASASRRGRRTAVLFGLTGRKTTTVATIAGLAETRLGAIRFDGTTSPVGRHTI